MADAVHYQLLKAVQAQIVALALPGVDPANVLLRQLPSDRELPDPIPPSVQVCPFGQERWADDAASFDTQSLEYPVLVAFVSAGNQQVAVDRDGLLRREQVLQRFASDGVADALGDTVAGVWRVLADPRPVVDTRLFADASLLVGAVLLWVAVNFTKTG